MDQQHQHPIFISHITSESALAIFLKKSLQSAFGVNVFVSSDGESIDAGDPWLKVLLDNLADTKILILLLSKDSISRPWVNFEAGVAWNKVVVIPVCHTDLRAADLPKPFNELQGVDAHQAQGLQSIYHSVKKALGIEPLQPDFFLMAAEIKGIEETLTVEKMNRLIEARLSDVNHSIPVRKIKKPTILCAASPQYTQLGFEQDVAKITKYFPEHVTVIDNIDSARLFEVLRKDHFDILHILAFSSKQGNIVFSDYDAKNQVFAVPIDSVSAEAFTVFIARANISLVILATCDTLHLANYLMDKTNLIAASDIIKTENIVEWEEEFFCCLHEGHSLMYAFGQAMKVKPLPLKLFPLYDLVFV